MLIYLASPYSHDDQAVMEHRYYSVLKFTSRLIDQNYIVYSPIVSTHYVTKLLNAGSFDFWEKYCYKLLSRCDRLWILTLEGWRESKGIKKEIEFARSLSIPIDHVHESDEIFPL